MINKIQSSLIVLLLFVIGIIIANNILKDKEILECKLNLEQIQRESKEAEVKNNQEIIQEKNDVLKRERKNILNPINDDLDWLSKNFNSNKDYQ